jgi:hypothetical protein
MVNVRGTGACSFGVYPLADNDCGSIYTVKAAPGNNCLPPMEWQTYDIIYHDATEQRQIRLKLPSITTEYLH